MIICVVITNTNLICKMKNLFSNVWIYFVDLKILDNRRMKNEM